jgi:hypothetical protein
MKPVFIMSISALRPEGKLRPVQALFPARSATAADNVDTRVMSIKRIGAINQ